jgi:hypothetical protein
MCPQLSKSGKSIAEVLLGANGLMNHVGGLANHAYRSAVEGAIARGKPVAVSVSVRGGFHMLVVVHCDATGFIAWDPAIGLTRHVAWNEARFSEDLLTLA